MHMSADQKMTINGLLSCSPGMEMLGFKVVELAPARAPEASKQDRASAGKSPCCPCQQWSGGREGILPNRIASHSNATFQFGSGHALSGGAGCQIRYFTVCLLESAEEGTLLAVARSVKSGILPCVP